MRPAQSANAAALDRARGLHRIEHGDPGRERIGELLDRRRTGLLQMVGADIHRVPLRHLLGREKDHVLDQPHGRAGREHIGAAREIFLDDVVLCRPLELLARDPLFVGDRDIEGEQPGGGRIDRHRGVHLAERNALEQGPHVAEMADRDANLAHLPPRQRMVAVIAGLGRQVEGDRQAGLPVGEVSPIERVRLLRRRMTRIGPNDPGFVTHGASLQPFLTRDSPDEA